MTQINGLLTQKPDRPAPAAGESRRFSWEQRTGKSGKPWIKIKNEGKDYGSECQIVSAEKTDFSDAHGNVSFNVSFVPQDGAGAVGGSNGSAAPATSDRSAEINRAVAFKGAVELAASQLQSGKLAPEGATAYIQTMTAELLTVVEGAADPKDVVSKTTEVNGDDDIPF